MWVSMAFNIGIKEAKGEYVILQHNDILYHNNYIPEFIEKLESAELSYITVDSKLISIPTYLINKEFFDDNGFTLDETNFKFGKYRPIKGGYIKTKQFGFSDAYFFLTRRSFFDDYYVDWDYGDTNHGATMYCIKNNLKYWHIGPYYDNPCFDSPDGLHTYYYRDKFLTHLKGGFSERKMSHHMFKEEFNNYLKLINNE